MNKDALRLEERISGPYQKPLSSVNKRSRVGSIAHFAHDYGWDVYIYECVNYTGDTQLKSGGIKKGKEETYTWTVGRKLYGEKWYVYKYSELVCKLNGYFVEYEQLREFISGARRAEDILPQRESNLSSVN